MTMRYVEGFDALRDCSETLDISKMCEDAKKPVDFDRDRLPEEWGFTKFPKAADMAFPIPLKMWYAAAGIDYEKFVKEFQEAEVDPLGKFEFVKPSVKVEEQNLSAVVDLNTLGNIGVYDTSSNTAGSAMDMMAKGNQMWVQKVMPIERDLSALRANPEITSAVGYTGSFTSLKSGAPIPDPELVTSFDCHYEVRIPEPEPDAVARLQESIKSNSTGYELPPASPSVLGTVKIGSGLSIDRSTGCISIVPSEVPNTTISSNTTLTGAIQISNSNMPYYSMGSVVPLELRDIQKPKKITDLSLCSRQSPDAALCYPFDSQKTKTKFIEVDREHEYWKSLPGLIPHLEGRWLKFGATDKRINAQGFHDLECMALHYDLVIEENTLFKGKVEQNLYGLLIPTIFLK